MAYTAAEAIANARRERDHPTMDPDDKGYPWLQGWCLYAVREFLGVSVVHRSAILAGRAAKGKHPKDRRPPAGSPVFWDVGAHGHIALSDGPSSGVWYVWSTDALHPGKVDRVPLSHFEKVWGAKYLGWTDTLNGVTAPAAPKAHRAPRTVKTWVGATIGAIAAAAGLSVAQVAGLNPGIPDFGNLTPGTTVTLGPTARPVTPPAVPKPRTLKVGMHGPDVAVLESCLVRNWGFPAIWFDDEFTAPTVGAVNRVVAATPGLGLADGTATVRTQAAACAATYTYSLRVGDKGGEVATLQRQLTAAGWPTKVTGVYDAATHRQVRKAQKAAGLAPQKAAVGAVARGWIARRAATH